MGGNIHIFLYFKVIVVIIFNGKFSLQLSCKDEENREVDWFINYKLPKIRGSLNPRLRAGRAYAYLTSTKPTNWILSSATVDSKVSMLARTWQDFANRQQSKQEVSYMFYNDHPPDIHQDKVANGHLKGFFAFGYKQGFWITHSIPRFGDTHEYEYPATAMVNGQTALCITFNVSALNNICHHLLYCNPNIYERGVTNFMSKLLDRKAKTIFTEDPEFVRKPPFTRDSVVRSSNDEVFILFAKDNQFKYDIYSHLIAGKLEASLLAATWQRGAGGKRPAHCDSEYTVVNIETLKMTVPGEKREEIISFKSTEDHSKWAISIDPASSWVCIGDLNRMLSQQNRGGGAVCFQSKEVWRAFFSIISTTEPCKT